MTKKEEMRQKRYYEQMERNSRIFSDLFIQRLGLEKEDGTGFLVKEPDNDEGEFYLNMNPQGETIKFDGFRYVTFEDFYLYQDKSTVKVFDPYNNIKLCSFLFNWYLVNIMRYNLDNVIIVGITNAKMNDNGFAFIKARDIEGRIWEVDGNCYNRDCIKYLDLIYRLDEALPMEYDKLREVDMVQYDNFN